MSAAAWLIAARIAREEWRAMLRNRVALAASGLLIALVITAALVSLEQHRTVNSERTRYQTMVDQQWQAQPDRHPHRVVHYGHFVFRPLTPLAFFDFGIDRYTGHAMYLEGHRQNTANFSDARQSSLLLRFGQLTPAFVLQTLAPLLIIFLAFGSIARERERGLLRLVLSQGVRGRQLLVGKMLGHAAIAGLIAVPAFVALAAIALVNDGLWRSALLIGAGYCAYLLFWVAAALIISAALPRARDALLALIALWMTSVILLPRTLPDLAAARTVLPTRIETDVAIHKELARIGDSHNPNDPYFNEFRARTLAQYGVSRIEDLPVNYGGLVMAEGERLTSELFDRHMQADFDRQHAQSGFVGAFAAISPVIALRQLSMALAGTDLVHHQHFLEDAERYRYALIQALNRLHAEQVHYHDDRAQRINRSHWQALPRFEYRPLALDSVLRSRVLPNLAIIALWLAIMAALIAPIGKRMERIAR